MYCKTDSFKHCVKQSLQIASIFWCKKVNFDDEILNQKIEEIVKYIERIDENVQ